MNIEKAIIDAVDKLAKKKIKSPKIDSEILMSQIIKKDRKFVILNPKMELQNDIFISFKIDNNIHPDPTPISKICSLFLCFEIFKTSSNNISVCGLGIKALSLMINSFYQKSFFTVK